MEDKGFYSWALVELMGHQRIAGLVTEAEIGGCKFVRVDVPASEGVQALTKYLGPSSIYAITPVTEETATKMAARLQVAPLSKFDARAMLEDKSSHALPSEVDAEDFEDGFVDDDE